MLAIWKVQQCTDYVLAKTLTRKREGKFKLVDRTDTIRSQL